MKHKVSVTVSVTTAGIDVTAQDLRRYLISAIEDFADGIDKAISEDLGYHETPDFLAIKVHS